MIDIKKMINKELKGGVKFLKAWGWGLTAHTDKPLFEEEFKHKRKWYGRYKR